MTIHDYSGLHCMDCGGEIEVLHHEDTEMKTRDRLRYNEFKKEVA